MPSSSADPTAEPLTAFPQTAVTRPTLRDRLRAARPYLALAGGATCIGFSAIWIRLAGTTGDLAAFFRMAIAAAAMAIPALINWRRGRARLPRAALPIALLAGCAFAVDTFFFSTGVTLSEAAVVTLLANTAPLWVGLVAWLLLREKLSPLYWLGLVVALSGVAVIIGRGVLAGSAINPGNLFGLASGAAYAVYQLITQRGRARIDTVTYSWLFTATGAVVLWGVTQALGHSVTGLPARTYLAMVGAGVISHTGGWLLINYAFGHLRASIVSVTLLIQPVITALVALPILGEAPTPWQIVGGLITLSGIYIVHRGRTEGEARPAAPSLPASGS